MDKIHRPDKPTKEDLIRLYKIFNKIIYEDDCYYNDDDLKEKECIVWTT